MGAKPSSLNTHRGVNTDEFHYGRRELQRLSRFLLTRKAEGVPTLNELFATEDAFLHACEHCNFADETFARALFGLFASGHRNMMNLADFGVFVTLLLNEDSALEQIWELFDSSEHGVVWADVRLMLLYGMRALRRLNMGRIFAHGENHAREVGTTLSDAEQKILRHVTADAHSEFLGRASRGKRASGGDQAPVSVSALLRASRVHAITSTLTLFEAVAASIPKSVPGTWPVHKRKRRSRAKQATVKRTGRHRYRQYVLDIKGSSENASVSCDPPKAVPVFTVHSSSGSGNTSLRINDELLATLRESIQDTLADTSIIVCPQCAHHHSHSHHRHHGHRRRPRSIRVDSYDSYDPYNSYDWESNQHRHHRHHRRQHRHRRHHHRHRHPRRHRHERSTGRRSRTRVVYASRPRRVRQRGRDVVAADAGVVWTSPSPSSSAPSSTSSASSSSTSSTSSSSTSSFSPAPSYTKRKPNRAAIKKDAKLVRKERGGTTKGGKRVRKSGHKRKRTQKNKRKQKKKASVDENRKITGSTVVDVEQNTITDTENRSRLELKEDGTLYEYQYEYLPHGAL